MKYYIPSILCGISIFWLSVTSGESLPQTFKDIMSVDKLAHSIAYGVQVSLLFFAAYKSKGFLTQKEILTFSLGVALYGFLMELIQYSFFPNRYFEVLDILANIMGIVVSAMICLFLFVRKAR